MEVDDRGRGDPEKMNSEYEQFLKDLEENPDMRFNISLYRNREYQPLEMTYVADGDDLPSIPVEELLVDLALSEEEDEGDDMRE
jgi:nonsense-mediated mRNA decay protein 3